MTNELIKKFGKDKRWVNYRAVPLKGRVTKIPYSITGKKASSTDASTWATYKEALAASDKVGIVFTPAQDLLGIDIDHCLTGKRITHEDKETIAQLIIEADTYTEVSPSGEGLHLFLSINGGGLALTANKKAPYEAYTSGRYFTFTGKVYGEEREIRSVTKEEALRILAIAGYPWKEAPAPAQPVAAKAQAPAPSHMDDAQVLKRMFTAKSGSKVKALYGGDLSEHKNDASSGDMALCSHLAFWTGKDAGQMERIWLKSPLGSREKTQKRKDYRDRTIGAAIASCKQGYEPKPAPSGELDLLYIPGPKGEPIYLQNTENMCRVLRHHARFTGRLRFDQFKNTYEIRTEKGAWRPVEDADAIDLQTQISVLFKDHFGRVGKEMVYDAMVKVGKENAFDSAIAYVSSIKWDGKDRLDHWLTNVYGVPDDVYHQAVASNWMKGLVKRIIEPGCKFDYVLVLEGEQGSRKSTSLAILGRDWHVETAMSTDSKDFFMQFQGKAIIEFSEGETLSRTEVKRMKAIITMQSDKYRPPYERTSQDFPRRCVFAMTTNQTEYLKDETGNRRWLPVAVVKDQADVEWLEANRDQLFAEAYHRVTAEKETIYEFPKLETMAAQAARRIHDPNSEMVADWYQRLEGDKRKYGITIYQVFRDALHGGFPGKPMNKYEEMSISSMLKEVLELEPRREMKDGVRQMRWYTKGAPKVEVKKEMDILEEVGTDKIW